MADYENAHTLVKKALERARHARKVGSSDLVIWGGNFPDKQLPAFLDAWEDLLIEKLPWRMYEYVSYFTVQEASANDLARPISWFDLERARLFGQLGDLDLRRDESTFRWRFIGAKNGIWPELSPTFKVRDFWTKPSSNPSVFREVKHSYYQWRGTREQQRVGKKWLSDANLANQNVYLEQRHYLLNGQVAFVRYVRFTTEGESDGQTTGTN